jgi:hypothetical protein
MRSRFLDALCRAHSVVWQVGGLWSLNRRDFCATGNFVPLGYRPDFSAIRVNVSEIDQFNSEFSLCLIELSRAMAEKRHILLFCRNPEQAKRGT